MRYFADATLALDALKKGLGAEDPSFKIDGGEVSQNGQVLAEIEINKPPSDMFADDIDSMVARLQQSGAPRVIQRVQSTQSVLNVELMGPNAMELLGPFWNVLARLASGLWHIEGQGFFDQGQLVARC